MRIFGLMALILVLLMNMKGADANVMHPNSLNKTGRKIYKATSENDLEKIQAIVDKKGLSSSRLERKVNYRDSEGRTPLIIASMSGYHEIAKRLIDFGANTSWKDDYGKTAEDYAYRNNDSEMKGIVRISGEENDIHNESVTIYNDGSFSWRNCQNKKDFGGNTIPFKKVKKQFVFIPECAPDILYSWKDSDKYTKKIYDTKNFFEINEEKGLYTWRTPLGSYGYGTIPVRMKLRPDVKFVLLDNSMDKRDCRTFPKEEKDNTVYVSYITEINMSEYLLCSSGPVESWSAGIPEVVTELKNEKRYIENLFGINRTHEAIKSDKVDTLIKYAKKGDHSHITHSRDNFYGFLLDDGTNWTRSNLTNMLNILELNQNTRRDFIKYAPGVPHDRSRHVASKYRSYISP